MVYPLEISIIIPTYNKATRLEFLLESLCNQIIDSAFEVIVIDDGSNDSTKTQVLNYSNKLNIKYYFIENSGRSHARNYGLEKTNSRYVIFCDDDLILSRDFVGAHLSALKGNPNCIVHGKIWNLPYLRFFSDPKKGVLYRQIKDKISNDSVFYKYLINLDVIENLSLLDNQKKLTAFEKSLFRIYQQKNKRLQFLMCTGGNFSCEVSVISDIGAFDEKLDVRWGVEDLELGYRLNQKNYTFLYIEEASNYHITHYRESFEDDLRFSLELFYDKYKDPIILKLDEILLGKTNDFSKFLEEVDISVLNGLD